jgi:diaminopropionate ammonia-lyase
MQLLLNSCSEFDQRLDELDRRAFGTSAPGEVRSYLQSCPRHAVTPLHSLAGLATELGCDGVYVKDEGQRLGLGSFKALGGAYAVMRIAIARAEEVLKRSIAPSFLRNNEIAEITRGITFACATDGNHGRSVAAGAALANCRAVIFLHEGVSPQRDAGIQALGATTVRVSGRYDDSVLQARRISEERGWQLVSDTSWQGYENIPRTVMQGYTVLIAEALEQLAALDKVPSHVILQAGVGGFAAATAAYLTTCLGRGRPTIIVVEPERAECVLQSIQAGKPTRIELKEPTIMSMLECYEPSHVAFRILQRCAHAFMSIPDEFAVTAMRRFAVPCKGDIPVVSGESGAAGLGGLLALAENSSWREQARLEPRSTVLLVNTEAATDVDSYASLVGVAPHTVGLANTNRGP